MAVLDDLSGFEFEDLIEDVSRNLGYENVRQTDGGRDVIMEEVALQHPVYVPRKR
jgi:hypothetical protein